MSETSAETRKTGHLTAALKLAEQGWNVFPLVPGSKTPAIKGGRGCRDGTTDPAQIRKWWGPNPSRGIGANLGDDLIAVDVDLNHGGYHLKSFPPTLTHHSGRGNGNHHLIYRYEPGSLASKFKSDANVIGQGVDVRIGRGGYVVMPPTLHEDTNQPYTVGDENDQKIHTLTDEEVKAWYTELCLDLPKNLTRNTTPAQPRQILRAVPAGADALQDLLDNPPSEGGRNEWLTRVCGYLARTHRADQQTYSQQVDAANALLPDPLEESEVEKTKHSIFEKEKEQHPEREATSATGWLSPVGRQLNCVVQEGSGENGAWVLNPWADFDLKTDGVAIDDEGRRVFWVTLYWDGQEIQTTVSGETLSDERATRKWLGGFGASYDTPVNVVHKMSPSTRILRYLNSQKPQRVHVVQTMGWQDGDGWEGFVTGEGLITEHGPQTKEQAGVVLDLLVTRSKLANYRYGFERDRQTAVEVLRQVLQFQDPDVVAVFSAWWAACLLKPQVSEHVSLFPILGVEAASESGKTTGFFDLMVQLNGNTLGHVTPTKPVLRDYASSNRNGIVWVDDLDDLSPYEELLRASTTNGSVAKMDSDNNGVKSSQIVSPILLSGESLGFSGQKALADRAVVLNAPSPKERRNAAGRLQWEDIVDLRKRFPDLTVLSGWFVLDSLRWSDRVTQAVKKYKTSGRSGSKHGVLIAGACLLESMLAGEWVESGDTVDRVNRWVASQVDSDLAQDNSLTRDLLPWALRQWGNPGSITVQQGGRFDGLRTPVLVKEGEEVFGADVEIWYSPTLLADAWERHKNGRVRVRTESAQALVDQAAALGGQRKAHRITGTKQVVKMRRLPDDYVGTVLDRVGVEMG